MKRIIFCDINGVLGSTRESNAANVIANVPRVPSNHVWYFYPPYVARLEKLVKDMGAGIVICSSCRKTYTLDEIRNCVYNAGGHEASDAIIDSTPGEKMGVRMHRGREVAMWLALSDAWHDAAYVILDDADDFYPAQKQYHVQINPVVGLSDWDVRCAKAILTGNWDYIK